MIRRKFYGWFETGAFRLSLLPPDAPVRPSIVLMPDQLKNYLERKRGDVVWSPPLPYEAERYLDHN